MSYSGWNIPIERQQYLAEAIKFQLQTLGYHIPVNQNNLNWMMQQIGAQPYEYDFVLQQMNHITSNVNVLFGGTREIKEVCGACNGNRTFKCSSCYGKCVHLTDSGKYVKCSICNGLGIVPCVNCNGKGYKTKIVQI
jgi:hypothetical protein